jgi:hypothetical protein
MSPAKRIKIEAIKGWINTLTADSSYSQGLLRPYNGDELERMTSAQLSMLLHFVHASHHAAYRAGFDANRESLETGAV